MFSGRGHSSMSCSGDCVLRTEDGGAFPVHRSFLRTVSPYFRGLFHDGKTDVLLRGVKGSVLHVLLAHEYTDQLCVSNDNVGEVLATADMLLMDRCREKCMEMLRRNVQAENCLGVAEVTKQYSCSPSGDCVTEYVHGILTRSKTCCTRLRAWCNAVGDAPVLDQLELRRLLQCVRVGVCKPAALQEFQNLCPALANSLAYREAVLEALERGPCLCKPIPFLLGQNAAEEMDAADREAAGGGRRWQKSAPAEAAPADAADLGAAALPNDAEVADAGAVAAPAEIDAEEMM
ncbi:hypothetical protein HPB52_025478 [Rhipicephalus sanguineus]|uniref:BTB domain-containing protein n=1 Tax=Rhipicephalus sanguineus TaxID=34632 RepID=A0A9D4TCZ3_RHISA|nr:hypothetical protein HPB52_025478 [Rhipicephalus sanguineus]